MWCEKYTTLIECSWFPRNIYIGSPKSISDFQYVYRTSNMYIGLPICISDFQYVYLTSIMYIGLPICIPDFQYVYLTSNMYIWLPLCISDFQYVYRTSNMYIRFHMAFWLKRHPIQLSLKLYQHSIWTGVLKLKLPEPN